MYEFLVYSIRLCGMFHITLFNRLSFYLNDLLLGGNNLGWSCDFINNSSMEFNTINVRVSCVFNTALWHVPHNAVQ
jgi:hypothetical protein